MNSPFVAEDTGNIVGQKGEGSSNCCDKSRVVFRLTMLVCLESAIPLCILERLGTTLSNNLCIAFIILTINSFFVFNQCIAY